ncbi:MAG: histidinol-phosphate transaminase [Armatimonadota bacterium]|nr:histidinol-phosphate transaminase [Armatimonadota bacterium]
MDTLRRDHQRAAARPEVRALRPYRLDQSRFQVKLNQNENPYDWPEEIKEEVLRRLRASPWNRYPSVDAAPLRQALAEAMGLSSDMVAVTNGSNEAILALIQTYATGGSVVYPIPTYSMVRPLTVIGGATPIEVPLRPDFSLDAQALLTKAIETNARLVFLASPNNPTGNLFAREAILAVAGGSPGVVIVDEAYFSFSRTSFLDEVLRRDRFAVIRTFSKAFSLAGARVGWIMANSQIIAEVSKVLPPYNLDLFAQTTAIVALEHRDLLEKHVRVILRERDRVFAALSQMEGVHPYPSEANFILFRTRLPAQEVFDRLLERGILVRDVSSYPLLEGCLRVTIGRPQENDLFLEALEEILRKR